MPPSQMLGQHLTVPQIWGLIGLGVFYWVAGVLTIRYGGPILFATNLGRISTYIATIPLCYVMILSPESFLGISSKHRVTSVAIITAQASLMDGTALMWFPALYENEPLKKRNPGSATLFSRMGAAWLLYFVGLGFALALFTQ